MRQFKIVLALILIFPSLLYGQSLIVDRQFGGDRMDIGYCLIETNDNSILIGGTTSSSGKGKKDLYVIKTNLNGDTLWTKTYGGSEEELFQQLIETSENDYFIVGMTRSFNSASNLEALLIKINSNGDTLWTQTYNYSNKQSECFSIIEDNSGYFYLAARNLTEGNGLCEILKLNSKGDSIWLKPYGWGMPEKIINDTDSTLLVLGNAYSTEKSDDIFFMKINLKGDMIWKYEYGFEDSEIATDIIKAQNGDFFIAGYEDNNYFGKDILVLIGNQDGEIVNEKRYDYGIQKKAHSIIQIKNGDILIAGIIDHDDSNTTDFHLMNIDINGDTIWTMTINRFLSDYCYDVIEANNGFYYLIGYNFDQDIQLYGINPIIEPSGISQIKYNSIEVIPNPTNGQIRVKFPLEFIHSNMIIYSINGEKIASLVLTEHPMDLSGILYEKGIYIIQIEGANTISAPVIVY